jgi:hypothetical protein
LTVVSVSFVLGALNWFSTRRRDPPVLATM